MSLPYYLSKFLTPEEARGFYKLAIRRGGTNELVFRFIRNDFKHAEQVLMALNYGVKEEAT